MPLVAPDPAASPEPSPLLARDGRPVTVVHLAGELAPYARTGGLGEAVASLAAHQAASGIMTSIVMPLYRQARGRLAELVAVGDPFEVQVGYRRELAQLFTVPETSGNDGGHERRARRRPRHYFLANDYYFDRAGIYGDGGGDYGDNARRYAFFCAAALAALPRIAKGPIVLHAHDWHASLAPTYLRTWYATHPFYRDVSAVLSVHNAGFQGHFDPGIVPDLGLPWEVFNWHQMEWYGKLNLLKGGMAFSDAVVTVSPNHATELRTPAGGFGLHDAFRALGDRFTGIVNGIDQHIWDPERDPRIPARFSRDDLSGKRACRRALQEMYGLPERDDVPIFTMSARLVWQKGLDLVLADTGFFDLDAQFIFLGAGEQRYEDALRARAARAPAKVRVDTAFTDVKEHQLIAGGDVLLMPCQYEPCGLTQMRAQRYGTLPLVRAVGGLADTVEHGVTGFLFRAYDAGAFVAGVIRALRTFEDRPAWEAMMREAMARDFGWARSEERYLSVYRRVMHAATA
ncbi:MAG: glycogen synthase [Gemmatirosa sp.]